jgi:hypothetical protein
MRSATARRGGMLLEYSDVDQDTAYEVIEELDETTKLVFIGRSSFLFVLSVCLSFFLFKN